MEGFEPNQAEALTRGMGADPRAKGFYNHKYSTPHFIRVQNLKDTVYCPSQIPGYPDDSRSTRTPQVGAIERRKNYR